MNKIFNDVTRIEIKTKKYNKNINLDKLDNCDFIGVSNEENLYKDLEMLLKFLKCSIKDEYIFKWVIIAMHNILMEFMLTAIRGNSWKEVINVDKNGNEKVISIMQLYDKCTTNQDGKSIIKDTNKKRVLLIQLIDIRNNFMHPYFDFKLIDKTLMKKMLYNAIVIVEEISTNIDSINLIDSKIKKIIIKIKNKIYNM